MRLVKKFVGYAALWAISRPTFGWRFARVIDYKERVQ